MYLIFFRKVAIVSYVFKVMWPSVQTLNVATVKVRLPKLNFVLSMLSCEINDLICLGICESCRRLAK